MCVCVYTLCVRVRNGDAFVCWTFSIAGLHLTNDDDRMVMIIIIIIIIIMSHDVGLYSL